MDDCIHSVESAPDHFGIANVTDDIGRNHISALVHLRNETVEHTDALAARAQLVGEVRADEAGAAGYEDVLRQLRARRARRPRAACRPCRCAPR